MRESVAALALIRRQEDEDRYWLAHWNQGWNAYHFVGGHKHDDESFRECVIREIQEELRLQNQLDFSVAIVPSSRQHYRGWSERANEETEYTIELFDIALKDHIIANQEFDQGENRWLSVGEIHAGRCTDGSPISASMRQLMSNLAN